MALSRELSGQMVIILWEWDFWEELLNPFNPSSDSWAVRLLVSLAITVSRLLVSKANHRTGGGGWD